MPGARATWPQPCYQPARLYLSVKALPAWNLVPFKRATPSINLTPMTQLYSPVFPLTLSFPDRVSLSIAQAGLELLPQPPECWNYEHVPPQPSPSPPF